MGIGHFFNPTSGVNLLTSGNEECYVGETKVESIHGNRREWTFGLTLEIVGGTKTFVIHGMLTEVFVAAKTELILLFENKINVGGLIQITIGTKNERSLAVHVELDRGPKYHLGIAGQNRVISSDKFKAVQEQQILQAWRQRVGASVGWMAKHFDSYGTIIDEMVADKARASEIRSNASSQGLWAYKDCNIVCSTFKIDCSGALKVDPVGSLKVEADKKFRLKGSSVKLDGGGATFEVNGGLKANGTALTYG
jgi:hypothetical protein